jgi:hypothetical protein
MTNEDVRRQDYNEIASIIAQYEGSFFDESMPPTDGDNDGIQLFGGVRPLETK